MNKPQHAIFLAFITFSLALLVASAGTMFAMGDIAHHICVDRGASCYRSYRPAYVMVSIVFAAGQLALAGLAYVAHRIARTR